MITHYILFAFFIFIRLSFIFVKMPDKYIAITISIPKFNPNPVPAIFSYMLLGVSNPIRFLSIQTVLVLHNGVGIQNTSDSTLSPTALLTHLPDSGSSFFSPN